MIIVKITGGLGNQMFQYAAARRLANYHQTELKLDISDYKNQEEGFITKRLFKLDKFNIQCEIADDNDLVKYKTFLNNYFRITINKILARYYPGKQKTYVFQRKRTFHQSTLRLPDNIYLDGTWQSERYFRDIKDIIIREFTLKNSLSEKYSSLFDTIQNSNSVAIHVRRGDYLKTSKGNLYLKSCSIDYYKYAMAEIGMNVKKPQFFFFSDDIHWIKNNLATDSSDVVVSQFTNEDELVDFELMSACKHQIIANSSFSWWAAWLNKNSSKIIIAPSKWFSDDWTDTRYMIPDNWKLL